MQASHAHADRDLDAYFSPPEAVASLIGLEAGRLPQHVWEPAAGDGAIVRPLREAGYTVLATDIADYGCAGIIHSVDYLKTFGKPTAGGIVTNPPYRLALRFAEKALGEVPYVALLLRTNFLESTGRLPFFRQHPPARILVSSRRLPMMHRHGWTGPRAPSNTAFAWFVWDVEAEQKAVVDWFDWQDFCPAVQAAPHAAA